MLEIDNIEFRNFLSYGDYQSKIDFINLGQCLIVGEVADDGVATAGKRSNGAGKSAILNAILWCLFGRTMHSPAPGDKVVNWQFGKDCIVSVKLRNGDLVTRTRKASGRNELMVERAGENILATVSTSKNQQEQLNKLYGLDWDIFCGSAFFTQFNKPWMEMQEQQRKSIIERIIRLDRFSLYATITKEKIFKVTSDLEKLKSRREIIQKTIATIDNEVRESKISSDDFEKARITRYNEAMSKAEDYLQKKDNIVIPDKLKLESKWALVNKIIEKRTEINNQLQKTSITIDSKRRILTDYKVKIATWDDKAGKICLECNQEIDKKHTESMICPLNDKLINVEKEISLLSNDCKTLEGQLSKIDTQLLENKPKQTIKEVESLILQRDYFNDAAKLWVCSADKILLEQNQQLATIERLEKQLESLNEELVKIKESFNRVDILLMHLNYINKCYTDRKKIKSFGVERYRPLFNRRLEHYLELFGLDFTISLSESLSIESDHWNYEFMSGGERKKIDVAFMLSMFDLHDELYGRQCNLMVLDEVDGRLDDDGIDMLVNIIKTELADRVETILIISHRNQMKDVFPHQITVKRQNRLSFINEIR